MRAVIIFLLALAVVVDSTTSREKLKRTPQGIFVRDWNEYMGKWHMLAYKHSLRSLPASAFTDWDSLYKMDDAYPNFSIDTTWRKARSPCSQNYLTCSVTSPGSYIMKDFFGDLLSGNAVIVDADPGFRHYAIRWVCVRYLGDMCVDYWLNVKTRVPKPSRGLIARINRKLAELWDTSLADWDVVPRLKACYLTNPLIGPGARQKW